MEDHFSKLHDSSMQTSCVLIVHDLIPQLVAMNFCDIIIKFYEILYM